MACSQCAAENHTESTNLERVRYFPRQLLTADDMRTEQEYFREKLRRHNRFLHGWGVVCGLEVVRDPLQAMKVQVCPGYALGPWGDEIYVEEPAALDLSYCARPAAVPCNPQHGGVVQPLGKPVVLLVKIRYAECPSRPMRTLPAGCGCDDTACEYSRIRDGFEIQCSVKGTVPARTPRDESRDVPACPPCPTDPWILLAEVETTGTFTIRNEVRRVIGPNQEAQSRRADVVRGVRELDELSRGEYGMPLEQLLLDGTPQAALRMQRLTGIALKRKFATMQPAGSYSATGARHSWPWVDDSPESATNATQELAILQELRKPGPWNGRTLVASPQDPTQINWPEFKSEVEHERGLFKVLALYVSDRINGQPGKSIREYLESSESRKFEVGLDLAMLVFDAAVTGPVAALVGVPAVAVGVALVGIQFGYRKLTDPDEDRIGDSRS